MSEFHDRILRLIGERPGLTDREITNNVKGRSDNQQHVNHVCRLLESRGNLIRKVRADGLLGNYPTKAIAASSQLSMEDEPASKKSPVAKSPNGLMEDDVKRYLQQWLERNGWKVQIAWGRQRGIDILAIRGEEKWIIEVKGQASSDPMFNNYFLGVLGEVLQRMTDDSCKYSVAFPGIPKFERLWRELPVLVKARLRLSALFVATDEQVEERA